MKTTNILVGVAYDKLIHEHEFIRATDKEANKMFCVQCITCGICYCDLCGKTLKTSIVGFTNEKI